MPSRKLIVEVVGDASSLERTFKKASTETSRFGKRTDAAIGGLKGSIGATTAGLVGTTGLVAALKASSSAASNMAEQTSKANVVFGQASPVVKDFAENALGLAKDQALETASAMGALFRPLGFTEQAAADLSVSLTKLAVDLSSFSNVPVDEALTSIRAALVGEFEPSRRFGIVLSAARVEAEALAETGKKSAKALTEQEKVQARVNLIFRQSKQAQGDFARTSEGLANQQKTLDRNLRNLSITVGNLLNPALLIATGRANEFLTVVEQLNDPRKALPSFREFLKGVGTSIPKGSEAIPTIGPLLGALQTAFHDSGRKSGEEFLKGFAEATKNAFTLTLPKLNTAGAEDIVKFFKRQTQQQPGIATPFLDFQRAQAVNARSLRQQLQIIRATINVLRGRLGRATTLKAKTALLEEINALQEQAAGIVRTLRLARQEAAAARANAAKARAEARAAARERAAERRENRQFRLLGLGPGGTDLQPGVQGLRKQLGSLSDAVKGTFLDTGKTRSLLVNIRRLLSGALGKLSADVRNAIKGILDDIDQQLKDREGGFRKFRVVTTAALTAGLGLSREEREILRGRLARVGKGGTVAGGGRGPEARRSSTVNVTLLMDKQVVAQVTATELQRQAKRRAKSSRGRFGGVNTGLA